MYCIAPRPSGTVVGKPRAHSTPCVSGRTKTHHDAHGQPRYSVRLVKSQRHGERGQADHVVETWAPTGRCPQTLWAPVARPG